MYKVFGYKCIKCGYAFEKLVKNIAMKRIVCPKCGDIALYSIGLSAPNVSIPREHQSAPKDYDTHPLDGGIPFGEVPGDEVFEGIDKPGYRGPLP